eukprot:m.248891 g.248891  ORF g.248891 m.248891 type:complete len:133 (-) comp19509_c0_seq7:1011-1409(-)
MLHKLRCSTRRHATIVSQHGRTSSKRTIELHLRRRFDEPVEYAWVLKYSFLAVQNESETFSGDAKRCYLPIDKVCQLVLAKLALRSRHFDCPPSKHAICSLQCVTLENINYQQQVAARTQLSIFHACCILQK